MKKLILSVIVMGVSLFTRPQLLGAVTVDMFPPKPLTQEQWISKIFGDKASVAKAIIFHESQNSLNAKNWNCMYGNKSTFCKKEDRPKAWSVDCGIGQINVKGTVCPPELLTLDGNMKAIEVKYKTQGFSAWVSYNTGAYKKYL